MEAGRGPTRSGRPAKDGGLEAIAAGLQLGNLKPRNGMIREFRRIIEEIKALNSNLKVVGASSSGPNYCMAAVAPVLGRGSETRWSRS